MICLFSFVCLLLGCCVLRWFMNWVIMILCICIIGCWVRLVGWCVIVGWCCWCILYICWLL